MVALSLTLCAACTVAGIGGSHKRMDATIGGRPVKSGTEMWLGYGMTAACSTENWAGQVGVCGGRFGKKGATLARISLQ